MLTDKAQEEVFDLMVASHANRLKKLPVNTPERELYVGGLADGLSFAFDHPAIMAAHAR